MADSRIAPATGAQAVGAVTNDPRTQTLGRIRSLLERLPAQGYYLKVQGENTPLTADGINVALDKLGRGNAVAVVKDIGKGEGWGTTSYRRHTGNPRVVEQHANMFSQADNAQLLDFENALKAHLANPDAIPGRWGPK